jgi:hypothetical protein
LPKAGVIRNKLPHPNPSPTFRLRSIQAERGYATRHCEAHEEGNRLKQSYILKCLKSYLLKKEKFFIPVIAKHMKKETG